MTRYRLREAARSDFDVARKFTEDRVDSFMDYVTPEDCRYALTAVSPEGVVLGVAWMADRRDPFPGPDGPELNVVKATRGAATALADRVLSRARDAGVGTVFGDSQRLPRVVQLHLVHRWNATRWRPDPDFWQVPLHRT